MRQGRLLVANNISLPVHASVLEAFSVARGKFKRAGVLAKEQEMFVYRRSIDARDKKDIKFVYSVAFFSNAIYDKAHLLKHGISAVGNYSPEFVISGEKQIHPIVVVGSGPAGLFASLILAENGYKVTLLERGGSIDERKRIVDEFKHTRKLDENTNIQFGAGGAGTFSDGKLVTRINDSISSYILSRFVEFGAPREIEYLAKPHIGTDVLSVVIDRMIDRLITLGSTVLFNTKFIDFVDNNGKVTGVKTSSGDISCDALVLAIGHSARDTQHMLLSHNLIIEAKDFSVGLRIEHPKSVIDRGLYGELAGDPVLPSGEYNLSYNTKVRGVYTFCMCPGGVVVPATSELGGVVVNGMSYHSRDGKNSNSAICCSVFRSDYGSTPEKAIDFQRSIERAAFEAGGNNYNAPIVTVGDFLRGEAKAEPYEVFPTYFDGNGVTVCNPDRYLPSFVAEGIRGAILNFNNKISGFSMPGAVLTGPETRTSSPIRIVRDNDTRTALDFINLYPCGEGAGYAGGITSAAIDGIRTAMALMKTIKP